MKVLHIYKSYYPYTYGGIEKCIESLVKDMNAYGIHSELVVTAPIQEIKKCNEYGYPITYYPETIEIASCPFSISFFSAIKEKINQFDLLHYHFPWPFADFTSIFRRLNKPYIVTYHSDIVKQKNLLKLYQPLMYQFLKNANKVVATSKNYVLSSLPLQKIREKIDVIPIGLDDVAKKPVVSHNDVMNKPYYLFVGVLREYKGLKFLLECLNGNEPYQIVIAGGGPCFDDLNSFKEKKQLSNVHLLGRVDESMKHNLYKEAYGVIVPSYLRSEAYCYTLVEGLMYGKPIISTELNTGTSFVNQMGVTGLVVPPANPNALKVAMDELWNDHKKAAEYGAQARMRFEKLFTANLMSKKYFELYKNVMGA